MSETIERVAKAISDAIDPTSGDPIGVTFHHSEFVEGETIQEQLEQVKSICLAAARAAIEAMLPMSVKQIVWSEPSPPKEGVSYYDHCDAETPFGFYRIEWKSWKEYPGFTVAAPWGFIGTEDTLDGAKLSAQADLEAKILAALSTNSSSLPTPAATPTDSANHPPVESVGPNSEAQS